MLRGVCVCVVRVCVAFDATRSVAPDVNCRYTGGGGARSALLSSSTSFYELSSIPICWCLIRPVLIYQLQPTLPFLSLSLFSPSSLRYIIRLVKLSLSLVSTRMTRWTLSITSPFPWATTTTSCSPVSYYLFSFFFFFFIEGGLFCFFNVFLENIDQVSSISVSIQLTEL
jgi:hypothetical protein